MTPFIRHLLWEMLAWAVVCAGASGAEAAPRWPWWPRPKPPAPAPVPTPTPQPTPQPQPNPTKQIPSGVPQQAAFYYIGDNVPPIRSRDNSNLLKAAGLWWQSVSDSQLGNSGLVEIDYLRLWQRQANGADKLLAEQSFNGNVNVGGVGGLWSRNPYYGGSQQALPAKVQNGCLVFDPSTRADKVWHGWTSRATFDQSGGRIWTEMRVRISGNACVQCGGDAMLSTTSAVAYSSGWAELGRGNDATKGWAFRSPDWQVLTMGKP